MTEGMQGHTTAAAATERTAPLLFQRHGEKLRFVAVGAWNTLFSYGMLWLLDSALRDVVHYTVILILNWVIGITHNLFTFKLLVFKTRGNWLVEYARSYVVYATTLLLNLAIVSVIMELWHPRLGIAQLPAVIAVTAVSYLGHKHFTYRT